MAKIACSVGILTFNSEKTLRRALESVKDFEDIVLLDGGSTDGTLEIARTYGARIVPQDNAFKFADNRLANIGGVRNQAVAATRCEWFLFIDSDESISRGLARDIERITTSQPGDDSPSVYRIPIQYIVDGRPILHSSNYPGLQTRLFNKRSKPQFIRPVHNRVEFDNSALFGTLQNPWHVYLDSKNIRLFGAESKHYRRIEIEQLCALPWIDFLYYAIWRNLRAAIGLAFRSLRNYAIYGFKTSMPVRIELARVFSALLLMARAIGCKLRTLI